MDCSRKFATLSGEKVGSFGGLGDVESADAVRSDTGRDSGPGHGR